MAFRVSVGAALSTIDAATDIYVVKKYYESEELVGQGNALLAMISGNMLVQLIMVVGNYQRKSWKVKLREAIICLSFLRPAVDAYRVSTCHEDEDIATDTLSEMVINKGIELATESIPGCILQLYVWLLNPGKAGTYALVSIGISALTTGFTSAMIAFDMDVDMQHRSVQHDFYGYIPDDNSLRGRSFLLMMLLSCLHNLSRSIGCALLAAAEGGQSMFLFFIGGEMTFYLLWKILRSDFFWWPRVRGLLAAGVALTVRVLVKIIADYTGCLHMRHPYELGGFMFSLSMLWAQAFPFVALNLVEGKIYNKSEGIRSDEIFLLLSGNLILWVLLNVIFFCTIDISYLKTFFGTKTAPQYTVDLYERGESDEKKFDAIFTNRIEFTKPIHEKAKIWVKENIDRWRMEELDWFKVEMIPDEFLPKDVLEAEGGAKRMKRGGSSFREVVGLQERSVGRVHPQAEIVGLERSVQEESEGTIRKDNDSIGDNLKRNELISEWKGLASHLYELRSNNYKSNFILIKQHFTDKEELVHELVGQCPKFMEILSHILEDKFGWRIQKVDWTSEMKDWGLEECRRVGCSLATFLRKRKTGEHAIDAWRLHYAQLDVLFKEIDGFEEFMLVIANNTLRDSIYGMIFRVSVGAALSIIDAATDIYVISTYYKSKELVRQANILLVMLLVNIFAQLLQVLANYNKKSWPVFLKEAMITMLLFRPAVDAYRVSTNLQDEGAIFDELSMMMFTKGIELATESIPGCILQLYVWLLAPEKAGTFALLSIGISCLTTGFASAMIAFDMDVDVPHRKVQPKFYGYIPDDNSLRGRCFILMTLMSSLHNLSRSLGCALLVASDTGNLLWVFVGGEVGLYLFIKILRQDFYYWLPLTGILAVLVSGFQRLCVKVIADFTGCLHLRHPYEMGGLNFIISLVLAQIFPFVSLSFFPDSDMKEDIKYILVVFFVFWLLLNIIFFSTIDLTYLNTFIGVQSAPQYTIGLFLTGQSDAPKFDAVFTCRMAYSQSIHGEVKEWVAANIDQWRRIEPDWFNIELIPDEFLPKDAFEAEGGAKRRRSSVSLREIVGLSEGSVGRVHPQAVEEMKVEDT